MLYLLLALQSSIPTSNLSSNLPTVWFFSGEVDFTRPPPVICGVSTGTRYCTVHCLKLVGTRSHVHSFTRLHVHSFTRLHVHSYTRSHVYSYTRSHVYSFLIYISFRPKTSGPLGHAQLRANVRAGLHDASQTRSQPQANLFLVRILSFPCVILAFLI